MAGYRVRLRPQVEFDIAEAVDWYQSRASGVDQEFRDTVSQVIESLAEAPARYRILQDEVRRVILRRFPYAIFYFIDGTDVVVLACVHESRSPDRWPRR